MAALCAVFALSGGCRAAEPIGEWWLNPGMYSLHFQRDKGLRDENFGIGVEYRYSTEHSVTAGVFNNSDDERSRYLGWYWQPLSFGKVRAGAVLGALDGYPKMRDGGWFPAIIPALSTEFDRFGLNVLVIPGYKDRLYGALSFQFKLKVN